jgi:hypothetical protein
MTTATLTRRVTTAAWPSSSTGTPVARVIEFAAEYCTPTSPPAGAVTETAGWRGHLPCEGDA